MSSVRKVESARANGAKSTGPKTPEGRLNSALANKRHGLLAKTLCLTNETQSDLIEMQQEYTDHFQPVGPVEIDLIEAMAVAKWQERRIWTIQTATLDLRMDAQVSEIDEKFEGIDEPTRLAIAFGAEADKSKSLTLQLRYANTHRRAYEKSLEILRKLQAERKQSESSPVAETAHAAPHLIIDNSRKSNIANEPNPENEHHSNSDLSHTEAVANNLSNEPSPVIEQSSLEPGMLSGPNSIDQ